MSEPAAVLEAENDDDSRNVAQSKEPQVDENIKEEIPQENNADDEKLLNGKRARSVLFYFFIRKY